ncbi:MAG: hypothetical protein J1E85_07560 [Ruminococcus sp.]|nr:hypothetical protein [Ruminococcus sp.]
MTSAISLKDKFKQAFSFFQWELKSCAGTLTIYSILTAVFMVIILTLCLVFGTMADNSTAASGVSGDVNTVGFFPFTGLIFPELAEGEINSGFALARVIFQYLSFSMISFMTVIFTIVYTIKVFGYLHNKRQTDMYGSMPISRITLFLSKSATAFVFSVVPALVFLVIATVISLILGQPLLAGNAMMYAKIVMGSLACISAYGLIAVCCGTSINSVLMFIAVSVAYPMSAYLVRGIMDSFYIGSSSEYLNNSFIMKAFSPLSAYDGNNIIYWLVFTAVCLVASAYLVKNRKAERAQSSFAYYLPCHIVKVLVSFLAGMFLGVIFGSLNVFGFGFVGFVFGFILASVPAFIVCHLIFYHGFQKLVRTSILLGVLIVVVVGGMAFINFDVMGYNKFVPSVDEIESAGFIDSNNCYYNSDETCLDDVIKNSNADFDDEQRISSAIALHKLILEKIDDSSLLKFRMTWVNTLNSAVDFDFFEYDAFSYKMKNGQIVTRKFDTSFLEWDDTYSEMEDVYYEDDDYELFSVLISKLVCTKEYQQKYSAFINADLDEIDSMYMYATQTDKNGITTYYDYCLDEDTDKTKKYIEDRKKIIEAYRKDFEADTKDISKAMYYMGDYFIYNDYDGDEFSDYVCKIEVGYSNFNFSYGYLSEELVVPESYTNTIQVLKDLNILRSDGTPKKSGKYFWNSYDDSDEEDSYDYVNSYVS